MTECRSEAEGRAPVNQDNVQQEVAAPVRALLSDRTIERGTRSMVPADQNDRVPKRGRRPSAGEPGQRAAGGCSARTGAAVGQGESKRRPLAERAVALIHAGRPE